MREYEVPADEYWPFFDEWLRAVLLDSGVRGPICSAPDGPNTRVYWANGRELARVKLVFEETEND
jgi:hypothetical protein